MFPEMSLLIIMKSYRINSYVERETVMGIRVHKVVGYALTDVEYEKYTITDERINPLGYIRSDYEEQEDIWTLEGYLTYFENNSDKTKFMVSWMRKLLAEDVRGQIKLTELYSVIHWDAEFGLGNVLCIQDPWMYPNYYRYSDYIDWSEETQLHKQIDRIMPLTINPYPYEGFYDVLVDGTPMELDHKQKDIVRYFKRVEDDMTSSDIALCNNDVQGHLNIQNGLAQQVGFRNYDDLRDRVIHHIPETVVALCKYLLLFNDDDTIWTMKPIMYVYWG